MEVPYPKKDFAWYQFSPTVDNWIVDPSLYYSDEWYKYSTILCNDYVMDATPILLYISRFTEKVGTVKDVEGGSYNGKLFVVNLLYYVKLLTLVEDGVGEHKQLKHYTAFMKDIPEARLEVIERIKDNDLSYFIQYGGECHEPFDRRERFICPLNKEWNSDTMTWEG